MSPPACRRSGPGTRRRAALLAACLLAGTGIGTAGYLLTGSQWWFAAVPALLAAAWLAVADPERCLEERRPGS